MVKSRSFGYRNSSLHTFHDKLVEKQSLTIGVVTYRDPDFETGMRLMKETEPVVYLCAEDDYESATIHLSFHQIKLLRKALDNIEEQWKRDQLTQILQQ